MTYKECRESAVLIFVLLFGCWQPSNLAAEPGGGRHSSFAPKADSSKTRTILFLGNSLTAGYGLNPGQAFPDLIQKKIDSLGWHFRVINAGLSGETSAGGLRRIDWLLTKKIDVLILELGANDALRGIPLDFTRKNLQAILDKTKQKYPNVKIVIAGMQIPPNFGEKYTRQFHDLFPELAKRNDAVLIPFLLEGVGGVRDLNQADGIHPTATGHEIIAQTVWQVLKPVLVEMQHRTGG